MGDVPSLTAQCNANQNAARKCGAFQLVDYLIFPDNGELLGLALDDVDDADDSEDKENNIQDPCYESQSRDFADDEAHNPAEQEYKALICMEAGELGFFRGYQGNKHKDAQIREY